MADLDARVAALERSSKLRGKMVPWIWGTLLTLCVATFATGVKIQHDNQAAQHAQARKQEVQARQLVEGCRRGNILRAYLHKRARALKGGTPADLNVIVRGFPILNCEATFGEGRIVPAGVPLPLHVQREYERVLYRCECLPFVHRGRIVSTLPFAPERR